ncbi:MAG: type II secretion system protein GspD [Gammaproteobacteria bacterium]|nr:type II secretion system protein GspD [Gammaproteobacteria bacterium]|tara:strand:- start:5510 stop:7477 length:1968 start_codon:yes stop_codon:yes gene_type:complete
MIQNNKSKHLKLRLIIFILILNFVAITSAQETGITLNWKDADIRIVVEAVSEATGKNFILDPRVTGNVNLLSAEPMSKDAFYEAFLSILQVHGYIAIESGNLIKILPDATARQFPSQYGTENIRGADSLATQVIKVENVNATQLVPILRPLIPQYGHLVAHAGSNTLIISDRVANLKRVTSIIRRIDMASSEDIEVVQLTNASASEIVRIMTSFPQSSSDSAANGMSLAADARTNSVLIGGALSDRLRLRTLITHLDTPLENGGDTQVRYLRYADAEELSAKLQAHASTQAATIAEQGSNQTSNDNISIWADTQTNAIVVNAPPKMMRSLMRIVDKLDIRRAQVLVEAIIVEVIADQKNELGVSWAIESSGSNAPIAVTNFPDFLNGVVQVGAAAGSGSSPSSGLIGEGITLGVGRISNSSVSFAAILRALEGEADTNIISTPSIVTTDNEEATLNVGQEVPFVTGSFTNTGGSGGSVNPFQTINRQQIGVKLSITPQINESNSLVLDISQEISSIAQSAGGAVDLITNQRIIETTVIVDDGEILVLGGLLEDVLRESDQRVPVLGSIPLLGNLFRSKKTEKVKTNLMIFIRSEILRDSSQTAVETNAKYNFIREIQKGNQGNDISLMPGQTRPILPPLSNEQVQRQENIEKVTK